MAGRHLRSVEQLPTRRRGGPLCIAAVLLLGAAACAQNDAVSAPAGEPLPGLRSAESARFHAGRALFDKVFSPEEGLGPFFNENQCSACHTDPASGGTTGFERIVRVARLADDGSCDMLVEAGGENVQSQVTALAKARGIAAPSIPAHATDTGRFTPTALFGLGLVEAIAEDEILARADPDDRDGDGISGRAGRTADGRLARFGRKAEFATIAEFTEGALRLEMGLTSPGAPHEVDVEGAAWPAHIDPMPEPEVSTTSVALLADFVRFLAPPARADARSMAHGDSVRAGRRLFGSLGCEGCHVPSMQTAESAVPALNRKRVELYSDLLLHDMGDGLANVCARTAGVTELRTAMLMGLRHRNRLLHDGRTSDLRAAMLAHGGEAAAARAAFARLPWIQQEILILFLESL